MSMPDPPTTDQPGEGTQSSGSGRRPASIVGLSIVSGLNVLCLAFLAYHFAGHPDQPEVGPAETSPLGETMMATPSSSEPTEDIGGNIDLAPASKLVLSIASGIMVTESDPDGQGDSRRVVPSNFSVDRNSTPAQGDQPAEHWVQLGALSKEIVARRYWSDLKRRHAALLESREPRYFGPAEVGGSLYHVRVGPMSVEAASTLCGQLVTDGADCFCIGSDDEWF